MNVHVTVVGNGHLGLTHAVCLAELGHEVLGVDSDVEKVRRLATGEPTVYEPGVADLLQRHTSSGRLRFTTDTAEAADFADVHFLCVGTPQRPNSLAADTDFLVDAVTALVPHLRRPALLVGKSTVPPGTAQQLAAQASSLAPSGVVVEVAWNPEFLREGHAVEDTLAPDRIVLGVPSTEAEKVLREVYGRLLDNGVRAVVTDVATAEMTKLAANAFLATKVSYINAVAELCEATGADVKVVAEALAYDARIGRGYLNAGVGFGGGCLPKDLRAMMASAAEHGSHDIFALLHQVDGINTRCRGRILSIAAELCGGNVSAHRIAVLGAAFKPGTDDVRDSPALQVAAQLHARGADVRVYDPRANGNGAVRYPYLHFAAGVPQALHGADLVLHLTEWPEFRQLDPARLRPMVRRARIIDGRNTLDPDRWRAAGWTFRGVGR
jgi:UDPglucose 6-dehydrogenase